MNHLFDGLLGHQDPASPFAVDHDGPVRDLTYADVHDLSGRLASALVSMGVEPGDRVAAQVPKSIDALMLYLATVRAGGVFLPLNTAYTAAEIDYFVGDATPRVLVADPVHSHELAPIASRHGASLATLGVGEGSLLDARAPAGSHFAPVPRAADDLAAILYTSGTTGRSKGAMLTHDNLLSNALTLESAWAFTAADKLIHALPIFHTHGLFVATNTVLRAGASLHFLHKFDAERVIALMAQATCLMGVPTFYTRLLKAPGLAEAAKGMRLFVSGSAPLLAETHRDFEAITGQAILERYGMTETNMNTSNPYDGARRAGTVGPPLPGVEVRITDPASEGTELLQGETGMIEVRGPNVFKGYWNMPEKTAEEKRADGWFITGDLGLIDADGYVHIVGRAKDLIISGGFNVYPKEVELAIDEMDGVVESAVIGVPHPDFGEAVVAVVVPAASGAPDAAAIEAALKQTLARYKQPKHIAFTEALPRNTMGKVQKVALRDEFSNIFKS